MTIYYTNGNEIECEEITFCGSTIFVETADNSYKVSVFDIDRITDSENN